MKTFEIPVDENLETLVVKAHNQREESLCRIILQIQEQCVEYAKKDTFGDSTDSVIMRDSRRIDGMLDALFFLECFPSGHTLYSEHSIHDAIYKMAK